MITPAQSRAGRALLTWSQQALADACQVDIAAIRAFEDGQAIQPELAMDAIRRALRAAGVLLMGEGELVDGGPGVRLGALGTSIGEAVERDEQSNDNVRRDQSENRQESNG